MAHQTTHTWGTEDAWVHYVGYTSKETFCFTNIGSFQPTDYVLNKSKSILQQTLIIITTLIILLCLQACYVTYLYPGDIWLEKQKHDNNFNIW